MIFNIQLSHNYYKQVNEIKELIEYINYIKEKFNITRYQEIFLVGDFKSDSNKNHIQNMIINLNLLLITPKNKESHMFYWRNDPYINLNFLYSGSIKNKLSRYNWESIVLKKY